MATYTKVQACHETLGASTVDTVDLTGTWTQVTVYNRTGTNEIYFTWGNGTEVPATPTAGGDNEYVVPAVAGASVVLKAQQSSQGIVTPSFKLISAGAMAYSVVGSNA